MLGESALKSLGPTWIVRYRLILYLLEASSEFIQSIAVLGSADSINLFELGNVEGMSIAVVGISVVASDRGIALTIVNRGIIDILVATNLIGVVTV